MRQALKYAVGAACAVVASHLLLLRVLGPCALASFVEGDCRRDDEATNNIGRRDAGARARRYGPIDVVYTWVNGSDPVWLAAKARYTTKHQRRRLLYHTDDYTPYDDYQKYHHDEYKGNHWDDYPDSWADPVVPNATDDSTPAPTPDESSSESRYRDTGELRYSLRSLEKYAPWVRHIYLVTDDQIPYWLNMDSDRLTVISHREIFGRRFRQYLPVFSSPAIETMLHKIRGLSDRFIYFNDDVLLGAETWPDDFLTAAGAPRIYLAWDVPKCANECMDTWLGDGTCDASCNVSACEYDKGDCDGVTEAVSSDNKYGSFDGHHAHGSGRKCRRGCPSAWLGDGTCDERCNVVECGYDAGDCGSFLDVFSSQENGTIDIPRGSAGGYADLAGDFGANCSFSRAHFVHAPEFVVESLILEAPQILLVLVDRNASNGTWSAVVEATCTVVNATEERNGTYAFRLVDAETPVSVETVTSCLATNYGSLLPLVPTFTRAIRLNATEGVVEVAASVAGPNGTVSTKLTLNIEKLRRGAHLLLPLPGEDEWGQLSNDAAHMAVENGSHVAAVLRVLHNGEEYACFAYDAQNEQRRRLLDSYGESLVRANRLYDTAFGAKPRRVPAHMPHLIDKRKMAALQKRFPEPWHNTAKRRFRSGADAQYAFSYVHYLMESHDAYEVDLREVWSELDSDHDGELRGNEVISLAAGVLGKEPTDEDIERIYECASRRRAVPRLFYNSDARSSKYERYTRIVTKGSLAKCDEAVDGLRDQYRKRFKRRDAYKVEETLDEVAFEMLGDDYDATKRQLDSIRARRTKFVCVNDNVRIMTPALADLFEAFFLSFFPFPSSFELPRGQRNRYLRLDAYNAAKRRERAAAAAGLCVLFALVVVAVASYASSSSSSSRGKDE